MYTILLVRLLLGMCTRIQLSLCGFSPLGEQVGIRLAFNIFIPLDNLENLLYNSGWYKYFSACVVILMYNRALIYEQF